MYPGLLTIALNATHAHARRQFWISYLIATAWAQEVHILCSWLQCFADQPMNDWDDLGAVLLANIRYMLYSTDDLLSRSRYTVITQTSHSRYPSPWRHYAQYAVAIIVCRTLAGDHWCVTHAQYWQRCTQAVIVWHLQFVFAGRVFTVWRLHYLAVTRLIELL